MSLIHSPLRVRQCVDFSDMQFQLPGRNGPVHPTDVDAFMEFGGTHAVAVELKVRGTRLPDGQRRALESLVDAATKGGLVTLGIVAEHDTLPRDYIMCGAATVHAVRWEGRWVEQRKPLTVRAAVSRFLTQQGLMPRAPYGDDLPFDELMEVMG